MIGELRLREDRDYTIEELAGMVKESLEVDLSEAKEISQEILSFVDEKLRKAVSLLRDKGFGEPRIESELPRSDPERLNMGQWVGEYRFYSKVLGDYIYILVDPKVGKSAFETMLNEITDFALRYGLPSLYITFRGTFSSSSATRDILYSFLLSALTELALTEGLPAEVVEEEKYLPEVHGRIDFKKLLKYIPKGVFPVKRRRVAYARLPRIMLAKFHLLLLRRLMDNKKMYGEEISRILDNSIGKHSYFLSSEHLFEVLPQAFSSPIETPEAIEEIKKVSTTKEMLKMISDLYIAYLTKEREPTTEIILAPWREEIPAAVYPSSKIYEFWVLKLIDDELKKAFGTPNLARKNGGLSLSYDHSKLLFDYVYSGWSSVIGRAIATVPRPDYVLSMDSSRAIIDAKYRERKNIRLEDFERMLAYIIDIASPDIPELAGCFVTLGSERKEVELWTLRPDVEPKLKIYTTVVDPRNLPGSYQNIRKLMLEVLLKRS